MRIELQKIILLRRAEWRLARLPRERARLDSSALIGFYNERQIARAPLLSRVEARLALQ